MAYPVLGSPSPSDFFPLLAFWQLAEGWENHTHGSNPVGVVPASVRDIEASRARYEPGVRQRASGVTQCRLLWNNGPYVTVALRLSGLDLPPNGGPMMKKPLLAILLRTMGLRNRWSRWPGVDGSFWLGLLGTAVPVVVLSLLSQKGQSAPSPVEPVSQWSLHWIGALLLFIIALIAVFQTNKRLTKRGIEVGLLLAAIALLTTCVRNMSELAA